MSNVRHVSFEELAGKLADLLDKVRNERTTIVVEYANGENVLIKPHASTHHNAHEAAPTDDHILPPQQIPDPVGTGTTGAVYELDPDSLTPG